MRLFAAALSLFIVGMSSVVSAQDIIGHYDHNGSQMIATGSEKGDGITITYVEPKPSLGIARGAWLFKGSVSANGRFSGWARVFKDTCNPGEYEVTGYYDGDDIVLEGEAPIWNGCSVVGFEWNEHHSYLRFDLIP